MGSNHPAQWAECKASFRTVERQKIVCCHELMLGSFLSKERDTVSYVVSRGWTVPVTEQQQHL